MIGLSDPVGSKKKHYDYKIAGTLLVYSVKLQGLQVPSCKLGEFMNSDLVID